jgi:phosphoribosylformimino-5-aminoimidazole carboxamide ribotide isomerase
MGATFLHVVDLDGAIEGKFKNLELIKEMARDVKIARIELGGGLRDESIISQVLDAGVHKVVIGTKTLDKKFLSSVLRKFNNRIVVGIDAKDGFVYTKGWLYKSKLKATDLLSRAIALGAKIINYTDISRDGMLGGPNTDSLRAILHVAKDRAGVVASGGISTIEDVKKLKSLEPEGLKGIIIGKALYERRIDLKEAIRICSEEAK